MRTIRRVSSTAAIVATLVAAVAAAQGAGESVVNPRAPSTSLPWTIGPQPVVHLGGERVPLDQVVDARRLPDGGIVVANAGSGQLLVFSGPQLARTLGGRGDGPGEFRRITSVQVAADSIYVFDRQHQRLSVFEYPDGRLARVERLSEGQRQAAFVRRFGDGSWYSRDEDRPLLGAAGGLQQDTVGVTRLNGALVRQMQLGRLPGEVTVTIQGPGGEPVYRPMPLGPSVLLSAFGNCVYLASGDSHDYRVVRSDGRVVQRVANPWPRVAVTRAHRETWANAQLDVVPPEAWEVVHPMIQRTPFPDSLPAYRRLVVDSVGYVWAQRYEPPFGDGVEWLVFTPDGQAAGLVRLPVPLDIYEIGRDYILGRWTNEFDEEFVRVYALGRPREEPRGAARVCS